MSEDHLKRVIKTINFNPCGSDDQIPVSLFKTWRTARRTGPRAGVLLDGAVGDQIFHHGRIGERRSIAERVDFIGGDLAQNAAHDLA